MPKEDPPYFLRYLVRDYDESDVSATLGALISDDHTRARHASVEVRVGDYQFDNTADDSTDKMFDIDDFDHYEPPSAAPIDDDADALRSTLWLQTDVRYKRALALLHKKRGARVTKVVEDETVASFSREEAGAGGGRPAAGQAGPQPVARSAAAGLGRVQGLPRHLRLAGQAERQPPDPLRRHQRGQRARQRAPDLGGALRGQRAGRRRAAGPPLQELLRRRRERAARREDPHRHRPEAGRGDPPPARVADDGPLQRPGHLAAGSGRRVLPRGARPPAGGRAAERQQGRRHLQGPDWQADPAHLPHHPGRPDDAPAGPRVAQRVLPLRRRGGAGPPGHAGREGRPAQLPQEPDPGEGLAHLERPRPGRRHAGSDRAHGQHRSSGRPGRSPTPS